MKEGTPKQLRGRSLGTRLSEAEYAQCEKAAARRGQTLSEWWFSYNSMLQLTQVSGGGRNIQYNYSANQNNGKIVSETDLVSGEQVNYTYDALNRLATAMTSDNPNVAQWGQSITYDGFGNLTNVNVIKGSAPALGVSYDPATNHGACTDANGNTGNVELSCGNYGYDVENRVIAYDPSGPYGGASAWYGYAPGNKRVWRGTGTYDSSTGTWSTDEDGDVLLFWRADGEERERVGVRGPAGGRSGSIIHMGRSGRARRRMGRRSSRGI